MNSFTAYFGGKERTFYLLSPEEMENLTAQLPNPSGEVIDINSLNRWSKSPTGCEWFIWVSAKKAQPNLTRDEVKGWGSVLQRTNLANKIFIDSISSGEEEPAPKAEGASPPPNPPIGT